MNFVAAATEVASGVTFMQIKLKNLRIYFRLPSSSAASTVRDSASPNPKMHQERNTIEIEMYCGSRYSKTAGTWSLTLVRLVNFIIFSGKVNPE